MTTPMQLLHRMGSDRSALQGRALTAQTSRRVWACARPYKAMIAGFALTVTAGTFLGLLPPLVIREILDSAIVERNGNYLNALFATLIAAAVGEALLSLLGRRLSAGIGEGLIFDLRRQLFDHVQHMPVAFFTNTQTGTLVSRLNNDVIGAQRAFTGTLGTVVGNLITLTGTLIAMILLEWRLTLLAMAILPIFVFPAQRVGRNLASITREGMNLNASMNNTMTERFNVAGALLVKLFGRHTHETQEFSNRAGRVRDIGVRSAMYSEVFLVALTLVGAIGTAVVYWLGGHLAIDGTLTLGTLVALGLYTVRIYIPLTSLSRARVDVMTAFVSFERVFEVLDTPNPITDSENAQELTNPRGKVQFSNVDFAYPPPLQGAPESLRAESGVARDVGVDDVVADDADDDIGDDNRRYDLGSGNILHGVNLTVEPGQMVAIVGPSGSGKTTLVSLVPRLYDTSAGIVAVDDQDVRNLEQDSLRLAIGVVTQDPHLFHDTIAANLRYAKPNATDTDLAAACQAARIHDAIISLPEGYDTVVGERGYRLSGGEKQRLAIARMLLKNPAIVILDEATSHLDTENEAQVQEALAEALKGRSALVIAHRLSTITHADQIIVLDEGRIVESGTHDELRQIGGLYSELYENLLRAEAESIAA